MVAARASSCHGDGVTRLRKPVAGPRDFGIRSVHQLVGSGIGHDRIGVLVERGTLLRIRRGWYVDSATWRTLSVDDQRLARIYLSWFGRRDDAGVVTGSTAAMLRGYFVLRPETVAHVSVPDGAVPHGGRNGIRQHRRSMSGEPVSWIQGVPVVSPTELLLDCARSMPHRDALVIADQAAADGADLAALTMAAGDLASRQGSSRVALVLARLDASAESAGETLARVLFHEWRIPLPVSQHWIATAAGWYRADFAWPAQRVVAEFDGRIKYFAFDPTDEVVYRERQREKALVNEGWRVLRVSWPDVTESSERFRRQLVAALQSSATGA